MFKRPFGCFVLVAALLMSKVATATTTVTGNIKNLGTGNVGTGSFVRFYLRGCAGNQPRVNGTAIIAPTLGNVYYFDIVPNSNGSIAPGTTLYSTRDSTGVGPGDIECGGSLTAVWYGMQPYLNGRAGPETPVHALSGGTLEISTVIPITANPVVTAAVGLTQLTLPGSISGFTTVRASPAASGILTLPAATDTLVGQNTTDTLSNKTLVGALLNGNTFANTTLATSLGSVTNPVYSFSQNTTTGFYMPSLNQITAAVGGVNGPTFSQTGITFGADGEFINFGLARDTSLSRLSAGALAVGNGNQGDASGTLNVTSINSPATGTANSTPTNFGSGSITLGTSFWNGSSAVSAPVSVTYGPAQVTNPNLFFTVAFPSSLPSNGFVQLQNNKLATSGANVNSPVLQFVGNTWNGSASQQDTWMLQNVMGSGANPTNTLNFTRFGGTGAGIVQLSGAGLQLGAADTGLFRIGAGVTAFGNGNQGDKSGTIAAAKLTDDGAGNFYLVQNTAQAFNTYLGGVYTWSSTGLANGPKDTGLSRLGAGSVGIGNGTSGDASGILKDTITNAVTGFQINGTAPSGHFLRGNGTNYVDGQVTATDITPGTNGQCMITSAGGAIWGSCAGGIAGPQINATSVTANASTTSAQPLQSVTFTGGVFNAVGKSFNVDVYGVLGAVNTTENIQISLLIASAGQKLIFNYTPTATSSTTWGAHLVCTVTTAGVSAQIICGGVATAAVNGGAVQQATAVDTGIFGVGDITGSVTFKTQVTFNTASTSNTVTQEYTNITPTN